MTSINEDDEEIEDLNYKEICELINSNNKVKAAKALANVIASMVEVPDNMYIAAVKDSDGNESIALRQTLKQRRPFGKEEEVKKSLFNIYNTDKDGIWINDWDNKDTALSKDIQDVITAIMKAIRAKETNDPCVWQLCDGPNVKSIDTADTIEDDDDDDEECDDPECSCHHHHDDDDEDEHEHHHHHHHHHGHDADEVFISWGEETHRKFTKAEIEHILQALEDAETYGIILRAKGYVANAEGEKWIHFDYVPGEPDIRDGGAMVTGRICVIGSKLNEEAVAKLFGVEKQ